MSGRIAMLVSPRGERWARLAALAACIILTIARPLPAHAQDAPAEPTAASRLALEVGAGVASLPDYPGSRSASARGRLWVDATWPTASAGTFVLDSGSLTLEPALRWSPFDPDATWGASLLLGYRTGRNDRDPSFGSTNDGSTRLKGLPDIAGSADVGFEAHARAFGVPVFAVVRHALHGAQATIVDIGVYAPMSIGGGAEVTLLPTLGWNDAREARAWYGIDAAAASASGRAPYQPGGGWQRAAVEVALDMPIAAHWHVVASVAVLRLLGDAASSPLVERAWQPRALVGIAWHR